MQVTPRRTHLLLSLGMGMNLKKLDDLQTETVDGDQNVDVTNFYAT